MESPSDADLARAMRALLTPNDAVVDAAMNALPAPIEIDEGDREAFAEMIRDIARAALT